MTLTQIIDRLVTEASEIESVPTIYEKKIGTLRVYHEQAKCADKIYEEFSRRCGPPTLISQAQSGKTGTCICLIDKFVDHCESTNTEYEIFYIVNISDNDLKDQTSIRLQQAWLDEMNNPNIRVIHHKGLIPKLTIDKAAKLRLIIIDECHVALGDKRPLANFLTKCGVNYGRPISEWENKNNFVLSVSATPFASVMKKYYDENCFSIITLEVGESYYGIADAELSGRFNQSLPVVKNNTVTDFYKERVEEFIEDCKLHGNGYQIVRTQGERPDIVARYVHETYGKDVNVASFHSKPKNECPYFTEKTIDKLDAQLSIAPKKPTVVIIRGGLRAGKTLSTTKNIRQWVDASKANADTAYQAIGRCFGYTSEDGHSKFKDVFPIYCNYDVMQEVMKFYVDYKCIPKSKWNGSSLDKNRYSMHIVNSAKEIPEHIPDTKNNLSKNDKNDLAEAIIKGVNRSAIKRVYVDEPNVNYLDSWNSLLEKHPDIQGKYVYFEKINPAQAKKHFDRINPKSVLAN